MSTRNRITGTVAALWAVAVAAIVAWFVSRPVEVYIGDDARDRIAREDGLAGLTRDRVYPESFDTTGFVTALVIATVVALVVVVLATIWTRD